MQKKTVTFAALARLPTASERKLPSRSEKKSVSKNDRSATNSGGQLMWLRLLSREVLICKKDSKSVHASLSGFTDSAIAPSASAWPLPVARSLPQREDRTRE